MPPARDVALLALLFRHSWTNRWTSIDSIITDQDICPGELSWFSLLAAHHLTEVDWSLVRKLGDEPRDFFRVARDADMLRGRGAAARRAAGGAPLPQEVGAAYADRRRWARVRTFMALFEREG